MTGLVGCAKRALGTDEGINPPLESDAAGRAEHRY